MMMVVYDEPEPEPEQMRAGWEPEPEIGPLSDIIIHDIFDVSIRIVVHIHKTHKKK